MYSSFNYQQLTCESCKVFFHRYGFQLNRFQCKGTNQCPIEAGISSKCKACRLKKCLAVGMIRTVEKNKQARNSSNSNSSNYQIVGKTSYENQALVPLPTTTSQMEVESQHFFEDLFTTAVPHFLVSPFNGLSSMGTSSTAKNRFEPLSDFESTKIAEIRHALDVVADERSLPVVARTDDCYAHFFSAEIYTRMFIKFCKRLSQFSLLNNNSQMKIIKQFLFDISTIRFAFAVDFSSSDGGSWNSVISEDATQTLAVPFQLEDPFNVFQAELEGDPVIRDLLTALAMFRKHSVVISSFEFIKYNFIFYFRLLQKYLEKKYANRARAEKKLTSLMRLMNTFDHIKSNERILFYEMDLTRVPTVYYEIYDL
ncbi:Oxysterols receptor LXR-alpha [Tyrophagus putrescentiae]|nr:Oxysterols receptor LXR-alpha [Tyrophagus putrescentiae]